MASPIVSQSRYIEVRDHPPHITKQITSIGPNQYTDAEIDNYLTTFLDVSENAQENERNEKAMSLAQGLKSFPKAIMWSVILSSTIIMEGYDISLLTNFFAFDGFVKKFGTYYPEIDQYQIETKWQTSLALSANVGQIIGLFAAGFFADRFGYRKTLIASLVMVTGFIFILFFAQNKETLLAGQILIGVPLGGFQTLSVSYASEVCPLALRLYLTTYANACWVIGQLIASCVLRGVLDSTNPDIYKIPFGLQWIFPIPIMIGIYLAPESPWWLAKKNRPDDARRSILRLLSKNAQLPDTTPLANAMLAQMQLTIQEEASINEGGSYLDCFKGNNFRRTRVAVMAWLSQNITGSTLMGYSTYFYLQAGLDNGMSFTFTIIQYALGLIGTMGSWFLSQKLGRFTIFFSGLCIQSVLLLIVGGMGCSSSEGASWGAGSMLLIFTFVYDMTIGPVTYTIVSEIPSVTLRTKTIILARNVYNVSGIVLYIVTPYMLNPTAWNWKAKTGFFWAGFAVACAVWAWFDLPETEGKTFAELDKLFEQGVTARKFKTTEVEVFNTQEFLNKAGDKRIKELVAANKEAEVESYVTSEESEV